MSLLVLNQNLIVRSGTFVGRSWIPDPHLRTVGKKVVFNLSKFELTMLMRAIPHFPLDWTLLLTSMLTLILQAAVLNALLGHLHNFPGEYCELPIRLNTEQLRSPGIKVERESFIRVL